MNESKTHFDSDCHFITPISHSLSTSSHFVAFEVGKASHYMNSSYLLFCHKGPWIHWRASALENKHSGDCNCLSLLLEICYFILSFQDLGNMMSGFKNSWGVLIMMILLPIHSFSILVKVESLVIVLTGKMISTYPRLAPRLHPTTWPWLLHCWCK